MNKLKPHRILHLKEATQSNAKYPLTSKAHIFVGVILSNQIGQFHVPPHVKTKSKIESSTPCFERFEGTRQHGTFENEKKNYKD